MGLLRQIWSNLANTAITETILMQISAEQVPSLHRVAPRYMKVVSFSDFWLFMVISALILFVLLVMNLLSFVLSSIPYAVALFMNQLVRS